MSLSIHALPQAIGHYTVDTVTRDKNICCMLLQEQLDEPARAIGYWSKTLNDKEIELTMTPRECFAVVWTVLLSRPYHDGSRLTVRNDHEALKCL